MKRFLKFFLVTLFFVELFMILGGGTLIYDSKYYLCSGILFALLISLLLMVLDTQSAKIEALKNVLSFWKQEQFRKRQARYFSQRRPLRQ